ncbi:MAG TPA: ABC transporter permease subunit, partial [Gammaproteobacteria bacterium]|nr:ABC transporter permease subunit [Gammaproteobacteria bacterium]
ARSKWGLLYAAFFLAATDALFRFGGTGDRVVLSLMNVVLLVIPLTSIVLGAMYLYSSREYIELLLSQPIERRSLFRGLFAGLALPLAAAFVAGVALPFLYHGALNGPTALPLLLLLATGVQLTVIFVALAFVIALATEDRIKGLGIALVAWLFLATLYDGLVLAFIHAFADFPLQKPVIAFSLLNPVDLGRILLLLELDASALMGVTGAVFRRFFGSGLGLAVTATALFAWLAIPFLLGQRAFARKNF